MYCKFKFNNDWKLGGGWTNQLSLINYPIRTTIGAELAN